jgi:hypothetical protein
LEAGNGPVTAFDPSGVISNENIFVIDGSGVEFQITRSDLSWLPASTKPNHTKAFANGSPISNNRLSPFSPDRRRLSSNRYSAARATTIVAPHDLASVEAGSQHKWCRAST